MNVLRRESRSVVATRVSLEASLGMRRDALGGPSPSAQDDNVGGEAQDDNMGGEAADVPQKYVQRPGSDNVAPQIAFDCATL